MKKTKLLVLSQPKSPQLKALPALEDTADISIVSTLEQAMPHVHEAEALLYWDCDPQFVREVFGLCRGLRWMHSKSAGIEDILFPELIESEVILTNSRGVYARSLAEFALCGLLYFAKDIPRMNRNKERENWEQFDVEELAGKTLGVFGYGAIGRETVKRAKAFGMRCIALRRRSDRNEGNDLIDRVIPLEEKAELFSESDHIVVTAPLTPETTAAVGKAELWLLKRHSIIVNLGRGPVIEEKALLSVLNENRIRGAVLDVFSTEPLPEGHRFWTMPNVLISPHTADHTATWKDESMEFFIGNCKRFAAGEPLHNVCDKNAGY